MHPHRPVLSVLVVDDHDIVRLGVRHLLSGCADTVDACDLGEARALLSRQPFDLLLLDLGLGDDFGLTALPGLRAAFPSLRIIVMTSMDEELYAERAVRAGADGFVMKTSMQATLRGAIDKVMSGEVYLSPSLSSRLLRRTLQGSIREAGEALSAREIEVLRLVAAGHSTREIASLLNRSVKTIETHKQSLKTKLGAESPAKLMRMALAWRGESA